MRKIVPVLAVLLAALAFYQFKKSKPMEPVIQAVEESPAILPVENSARETASVENAAPSAPAQEAAAVPVSTAGPSDTDWSEPEFKNPDGSYNVAAIADEKLRSGEITPEERAEYMNFLEMSQEQQRNQHEEVLEMGGEH